MKNRRFDVQQLSSAYRVRLMAEADLNLIEDLCKGNEQYYQYCRRTAAIEELKNDLTVTPPGKSLDEKYYVGFFEKDVLVAVMDLIDGYPDAVTAYVGFFMMNKSYQGCGTGTAIMMEVCEYLKTVGMKNVRLGIDKENPQSNHFWRKNGFVPVKEVELAQGMIVVAEKEL